MSENRLAMERALSTLRSVYGHDQFRSGQEKTVSAILSGRDVLGIMPTGTGKSVCYQVPAIVSEGLTLVISPLIALMYDQVMALKDKGVRAAYLNSTLNQRQQEIVLERASQGAYQLMYVTPERLETRAFRKFATSVRIPLIAVDEAHCIVRWGGDFRQAYAHIDDFVKNLPRRPVIAAFTATATDDVRDEIVRALDLRDPVKVISGFDRPNLRLEIQRANANQKNGKVLRYVRSHKRDCGIIYCTTRKAVESLARKLEGEGLSVGYYHGGMDADERDESQAAFIEGRKRIMVATNAFGMGVDKPDVRYVICYSMPASIEDYYQQIGRAGRDGQPAYCLMMYDDKDEDTIGWFISRIGEDSDLTPEQARAEKSRQERNLREILDFCKSRSCLRRQILDYFGDEGDGQGTCGNCSNCRTPSKQPQQKAPSSAKPGKRASKGRTAASVFEKELAISEIKRQEKMRKRSARRRERRLDSQEEKAKTDLRGEFAGWLKRQSTPKGTPYNPSTISGYCDRIQGTCNGPGFESVGAGDLFVISDPAKLRQVIAKMRRCPAYAEENERTTGGLNAALNKYAQFLEQRR